MTGRATSRIRTGVWIVILATLLTAAPLTAHASPGAGRGRGSEHRSARASQALDAAKALFRRNLDSRAPRSLRSTATTQSFSEATQVLRELVLHVDDLDAADRQVARRILARPTDGDADYWANGYAPGAPTASTCSDVARICLHWVTDAADKDAPELTDSDGDGVPDWVEETLTVLEQVWQRIVVDLGYRAPGSDEAAPNHGPDGRTDIYLADLRPDKMYGYCTMDSYQDKAAYCVLDNDFVDYPAPPASSLRVTAAHEFFHAVQFGYTLRADKWLQEGTAAWIEDEVFDGIDDNLQYLPGSALQHPGVPLDSIAGGYTELYGSWIWWRFLSEYFGAGASEDPSVVRQVWQRVGAGERSLVAQRRVLHNRSTSFEDMFAEFSAANRIARRWYDEGRKYAGYVAPVAGRFVLTRKRQQTPWLVTRLTHLSSRHVVVVPGRSLKGRWGLRMLLDLPPRFRGSKATAMVHRRDGRIGWRRVRLNRKGNARLRVPFTRRHVARISLSLTNASTRMAACGSDTAWSCGGTPRDDGPDGAGLPFTFKVRAVR